MSQSEIKKLNILKFLVIVVFLSGCINSTKNADQNRAAKAVRNKLLDSISVCDSSGKFIRYIVFTRDTGYYKGKYFNFIKGYRPEGINIYGDFNGDKVLDTASIISDEEIYGGYIESNQAHEKMDYKRIIKFSGKNISELLIDHCSEICGINEGDLNDDGKDEIGILPGWIMSECRYYLVFTYDNGKWVEICEPLPNSSNLRAAGLDFIKKDSTKKGNVIIRYSYENSPLCCCVKCPSIIEESIKLK